jgi:type IV secretory pathway VirB2 component (pilin)
MKTIGHLSGQKNRFMFAWRLTPAVLILAMGMPLYASIHYVSAKRTLYEAFTGTFALGTSLVAIVAGGLMFAFGKSESWRMLGGIFLGVGMAIGGVNISYALFP